MPDKEEQLSRYIDCLNQERKPPLPTDDGLEDWQQLLATVRLTKSLKDPAIPDEGFPRQMARRLSQALRGDGRMAQRSRWWWTGGAAAAVVLVLLFWQVLGSGAGDITAPQRQVAVESGEEAAQAPAVAFDYRQRKQLPENEAGLEGEAAAATAHAADASQVTEAPPAGSGARPDAGLPTAGDTRGQPSEQPAATASQEKAMAAVEEATAAGLPAGEKGALSSAADIEAQSGVSLTSESMNSPARSVSRQPQEESVPTPGLQVTVSLDQAGIEQPAHFTVRLRNAAAAGVSLSFPTPILVIREVGSGEAVWKAALTMNLPVFMATGEAMDLTTTWPGPERPGWYTATVEGVRATLTGTGSDSTVTVQHEPLEFFVPYPLASVRTTGDLQHPAQVVQKATRVAVERVGFTSEATVVTLTLQAADLDGPVDLRLALAWDSGDPQQPRRVTQEIREGVLQIKAWFNPTPADATALHLVVTVQDGPAGLSEQPWELDIPVVPVPVTRENAVGEPGTGSVPGGIYGGEEQPAGSEAP